MNSRLLIIRRWCKCVLDVFNISKLSHLSIKDKIALTFYPWRSCNPENSVPLKKPLSQCNVAIVSSAGLYIRDHQNKFDYKIMGGDFSFRIIPSDVELKNLYDSQRSGTYDHSGIRNNPSTGMPIPQLKQLEKDQIISFVNYRHISLMGAIIAPGRLIKNTIPKIVELLARDQVDVIFFVPV